MYIWTDTMTGDEVEPRLHDQWVKKLIDYFVSQDHVVLEEPTLREFKNKGWHKPDLLVFKRSGKTLKLLFVCEIIVQNVYEDSKEDPTESYQSVHTKLTKIKDSLGADVPVVIFEPVKWLNAHNLKPKRMHYAQIFKLKPSEITSYSKIQQLFRDKWEKEGLRNFKFWTEKQLGL